MSTIDRLHELMAAQTLHEWSSPLLPVKAKRRTFVVTNEVKADLDADPWPSLLLELPGQASDRRVRTHTMINAFVEGQNMTVGVGKDDADIKCLSPMQRVPSWRIIEFRAFEERRVSRVLGAFAAPDAFVALAVRARRIIVDWDKLAGSVDAAWMSLFPGEPPLVWSAAPRAADYGKNFSDY